MEVFVCSFVRSFVQALCVRRRRGDGGFVRLLLFDRCRRRRRCRCRRRRRGRRCRFSSFFVVAIVRRWRLGLGDRRWAIGVVRGDRRWAFGFRRLASSVWRLASDVWLPAFAVRYFFVGEVVFVVVVIVRLFLYCRSFTVEKQTAFVGFFVRSFCCVLFSGLLLFVRFFLRGAGCRSLASLCLCRCAFVCVRLGRVGGVLSSTAVLRACSASTSLLIGKAVESAPAELVRLTAPVKNSSKKGLRCTSTSE